MGPGSLEGITMATRRGLTLIETVLAAAMLAMVAAGVFGAISSMVASQDRQQQRLGAAEVCNRLILQYLDDKEGMPDPNLPVAYADRRYRWTSKEEAIRTKLPVTRAATDTSPRAGAAARSLSADRLKLVTVRAWLSEESGGSRTPEGLVPQFAITRVVDPLRFARNPDSFDHLLSTDAGMRRIMEELMGASGGQLPPQLSGSRPGGGGPGAGRGARPPSSGASPSSSGRD